MASDKKSDNKKRKPLTKDEIYLGFQTLRTEQRSLANKLSELEEDLNEHKVVIETLKLVNEDRKCFRMIGGILVERTVKEVLPVLLTNKEQLTKVIESLNNQLTKKGVEINEYKDLHNIKIRGQDDDTKSANNPANTGSDDSQTRKNVLVVNS